MSKIPSVKAVRRIFKLLALPSMALFTVVGTFSRVWDPYMA